MKLQHPESDQVIDPKVEHVETYETQGWVEVVEVDDKPKGK